MNLSKAYKSKNLKFIKKLKMESTKNYLLAVLNILRHLPPEKYTKNIGALTNLLPDQADKILSMVDSPLEIEMDTNVSKPFI